MIELFYMNQSMKEEDFDFHSHDAFEIYYFHEGRCTYLIADRIYHLSPGDLIIMHGMTLHRPNPDSSTKYVRSIIHFNPRYVERFMSQPGMIDLLLPFRHLKNHRFRLNGTKRRQRVETLFKEMARCDPASHHLARPRYFVWFLQLLIEIFEEYSILEEGDNRFTEKECIAQQVISFIEKHYSEDLNLDRIACELHLSKFYLAKVFKEMTGVTIMNYLMNKRVNHAKLSFLLNPDLTVTEISYRAGFKHPAHFSRAFKEQVGIPPDQYRKRLRNHEDGVAVQVGASGYEEKSHHGGEPDEILRIYRHDTGSHT
ncbi:AraC-like DNA-binding protein [Melghirimyces profundicolus]|uniref:AraC-like DNA-binding protein n=1 Tax=Melghirimyces profundicolus TaxID=1242148 RepID=A0A2T6C9F8_9BACL|nr:AraC family transcriptional regulator [Melghirimyces profundicolus]PTX64950.1 AraC-like DNA-binding protein [Melghirimyces profundicolus]